MRVQNVCKCKTSRQRLSPCHVPIIHPLDLWLEVDAEALMFFNMRTLKNTYKYKYKCSQNESVHRHQIVVKMFRVIVKYSRSC